MIFVILQIEAKTIENHKLWGRNMISRTNLKEFFIIWWFTFSCLFNINSSLAGNKITGKVIDQKTKQPIENVSVQIQGSAFQAITDANGKYAIDFVPGKFLVTFSVVGYFPQKLKLELAQKISFPADEIELMPAPPLVNMYIEPLDSAYVSLYQVSPFGEKQLLNFRSFTEKDGRYSLSYYPGVLEVVFKKAGYTPKQVRFSVDSGDFPSADKLVMCPEKYGLYINKQYIPAISIDFRKRAMDKYQPGSFAIPRIPAMYEGSYYITGSPNSITFEGTSFTFYLYPENPLSLGGPNIFAGENSFVLLKVRSDKKIAEFGLRQGNYQQIEFTCEPLVSESKTERFIHQKTELFKIRADLQPGDYVLCEWVKKMGEKIFHPGEKGYYFSVR